jgi:hypothetical protein
MERKPLLRGPRSYAVVRPGLPRAQYQATPNGLEGNSEASEGV